MRTGWLIVAMLALLLTTGGVHAQQNYPNKPIRLIVPFAAGGGSDFVGRLIGQKLTDQMGQTVVVDNRPGAASLVGTQIVARGPRRLHAAARGFRLHDQHRILQGPAVRPGQGL